jgi:putative ABC transport system permease protein
VLSRRFWERHFHSDPAVLGRPVELDRQPFTIIGVMPEGFEFLDATAEYWLSFYVDPHKDYRPSGRFMRAVARLKPGVTLQQAQAQLSGIAKRAEKGDPEFSRGWGVRRFRCEKWVRPRTR